MEHKRQYDREREKRRPPRRHGEVASARSWRAAHPDYQKEWMAARPDYMKDWRAAHPDHMKEYRARFPDRELARLVETDTRVAHCPASNLFLASGIMPLARFPHASTCP